MQAQQGPHVVQELLYACVHDLLGQQLLDEEEADEADVAQAALASLHAWQAQHTSAGTRGSCTAVARLLQRQQREEQAVTSPFTSSWHRRAAMHVWLHSSCQARART